MDLFVKLKESPPALVVDLSKSWSDEARAAAAEARKAGEGKLEEQANEHSGQTLVQAP